MWQPRFRKQCACPSVRVLRGGKTQTTSLALYLGHTRTTSLSLYSCPCWIYLVGRRHVLNQLICRRIRSPRNEVVAERPTRGVAQPWLMKGFTLVGDNVGRGAKFLLPSNIELNKRPDFQRPASVAAGAAYSIQRIKSQHLSQWRLRGAKHASN